jgi:adenosine A1 receptor
MCVVPLNERQFYVVGNKVQLKMAAIYGSSTYFWNITISEDSITLQHILKNYFSTITLITGVVLVVLGPFIMIANGIVIAAIWKDPFKHLRSSPSNIIIASMAACDFLVGIFAIAIQASWFITTSVRAPVASHLAPVAFGAADFLLGASVTHVLALTIDRVIAVVNPLLYKSRVTRKRVLVSMFLLWAFCLFAVLQIPLHNHYYIQNVLSITALSIISLLVTFLCFVIIYNVRKQTKIIKNKKSCATGRIITERDRKTTKSIIFILALFILCVTPFFFSCVVLLTCSSCRPHLNAVMTSLYSSYILTHVNSAINPILYAFRLPKFRKPVALILKKVLCCCNLCRRKIENVDSTEISSKTPRVTHNEASKKYKVKSYSYMNTKL